MVHYIIKKNIKRDTYYKVLNNGTCIRITQDEYIKKTNKKQIGGYGTCENLLGNLHKFCAESNSIKVHIDEKNCCIDKDVFVDLEIKKKIVAYLNNTYKISRTVIKEPAIIDDPSCKVYIIGDMEGNVFMLYQWFLKKGFINENLDWIHDNEKENIYVVQCGDQIDAKRFKNSVTSDNDIDVSVLLFMDYMNYISKNHVLSVIGNHEWVNIFSDFRLVKKDDMIKNRIFFFEYNQLLCRIIRRRNFVIRINNIIVSHAGVSYENIDMYKKIKGEPFTIDTFIRDINSEVDKPENYKRESVKSTIYLNVIIGNGILWNRYYKNIVMNNTEYKINPHDLDIQIAEELKDYIIVKGHDKGNSVWFCYNNTSLLSNKHKKKCVSNIDKRDIDKVSIITTDNIKLYYNILNFAELQFEDYKIINIDKNQYNFSHKLITHTNLWRNILDIYDSRISYMLNDIRIVPANTPLNMNSNSNSNSYSNSNNNNNVNRSMRIQNNNNSLNINNI